jgi:ABC-type antimicrobial peptide transport system permease subunit
VSARSILFTASGVVAFAMIANLAVRRRIGKLEIVEVLKSRE